MDGDVTGPRHQAGPVADFLNKCKQEDDDWFEAVTMYQFRDRGRLGLELEDPNNSGVGIPQPVLGSYKELLKKIYQPKFKQGEEELSLPVTLRWGGAEDADGICIPIAFEKRPEFCELYFEEELSLMLQINGRWFYKAPQTKFVDLMPAFFGEGLSGTGADNLYENGRTLALWIFATPPGGVNEENGREDWATDHYSVMTKLPKLRLRYEPCGVVPLHERKEQG